jgi:hypothetical protein
LPAIHSPDSPFSAPVPGNCIASDRTNDVGAERPAFAGNFRIAAKICEKSCDLWKKGRNPGKYPGFPGVVSHHVVRKSGISVHKADLFTPLIIAIKPFIFSGIRIFSLLRG